MKFQHRLMALSALTVPLANIEPRKKGEGHSRGGITAKAQWAKRGPKKKSRRRK